MPSLPILRIISGGQTGVDRAALDVALELGLPCGGWCPKDRRAEDGTIDQRYPLAQTPETEPAQRTRRNVRDSDGTLIIAPEPLTGGTALTQRLAIELGKPLLIVEPGAPGSAERIIAWIEDGSIAILNVAGPRESQCPGIHDRAAQLVRELLRPDEPGG